MLENESGDIVAVDQPNEVVEETNVETTPQEEKADGEVKRKRPSGFHRKISKLEQQLAEKDARLAELEQKIKPQAKVPQLGDFESFDAFNSALIQHKVDEVVKERETKAKEEQQRKEALAKQQEVLSAWEQKEESLGDAYEEYEQLVAENTETPFRQELIQATFESDLGPQVRHFLLKNPDELAKINNPNISSYAIYKRVAELEAKLSKPAVKVSKSPEPITPVKGTAKTAVKLDNLDTDSYIAQRYPGLYKK